MGRNADNADGLSAQALLFDPSDIPVWKITPEKNFSSLKHPLWTEGKARLIQEYLKLFTYITKHGAYIDGFAAPQRRDRMDLCSAKLVLETEPKRLRDFWLCDVDPNGVKLLEEMKANFVERNRRINVVFGDFNKTIDAILASRRITDKTATFALLDQRTFECFWETVEKISNFKNGMKIEIFYFFATGWIDRSIAAVSKPSTVERIEKWWGRSDWRDLRGMQSVERAKLVSNRFKSELGYAYAYPYAIHNRNRGNRTMYHMIHATDHTEASPLMQRAYRKVSGRSEKEAEQLALEWDDTLAE